MSIVLHPNIAKVKRNGVYQNLPGFVEQSGDADIEAMIANKETSTTAQFPHTKDSFFILNNILYQADENIAVNGTIAVGTNCHVEVLGNVVSNLGNNVSDLRSALDYLTNEEIVLISGAYINTQSDPIVTTPVTYATASYIILACFPGDFFTLNVLGTSVGAAYVFTDSSYNILKMEYGSSGGGLKDYLIEAPENAAYLIINAFGAHSCYKGVLLKKNLDDYNHSFDYERVFISSPVDGKYINTLGTLSNNSNFSYTRPMFIKSGTTIIFTASGAENVVSAISESNQEGTTIQPRYIYKTSNIEKCVYTAQKDTYIMLSYDHRKSNELLLLNLPSMYMINTDGRKVKLIAGIIRNNGSGWGFIDDDGHKPVNLGSVEVNTGGQVVVNYGYTAKNVLTLVATPDETFAENYRIGGSVGLSSTVFNIWRLSKTIGGRIKYRSGSWNIGDTGFTSYEWDSENSVLKLFHDSISSYGSSKRFIASVSKLAGCYTPEIYEFGSNYLAIKFYDNGTLVTTPSSSCDFVATRTLPEMLMNANDVVNANGNFWIMGMMEVDNL